jgi:hypothetical protein
MPKEQIKGLIASKFPELATPKEASLFDAPDMKDVGLAALSPIGFLASRSGDQRQAMLEQGMQGATANFSDNISDRIGARIAAEVTDESRPTWQKVAQFAASPLSSIINAPEGYGEILAQGRRDTGHRLDEQQKNFPQTSLTANIGGALLTGGALATTKPAAVLSRSLRTGGGVTNTLKGAGLGATQGAIQGAGAAGFDDSRLESAGEGALFGGLLGGAGVAIPTAIQAGVKGTKTSLLGARARDADELQEASQSLKKDAVAIKNRAELSKISLNPDETANLVSNLENALTGVKLIPEFTPKTIGVIRTIKEDIDKGSISLNDIDQYRRLLGGARAEDSVAASEVRKAIDNTLNSLSDQGRTGDSVRLLNEFRKEYTQAAKFSDVADVIKSAGGDRNKIKTKLAAFMRNEDNTRGWSEAEKAALKDAAERSTGENILNSLGRFGFDKNNIAFPTITAGGSILAPQIAMPLVVAGSAARQAGKFLARGKAEKLLQIIESGSKITAKDVKDLPPRQATEILNLVQRTDAMNPQELRAFIEQNTK